MKIAIITAIYGNYDDLKDLPDNHGFDRALCITDNPTIKGKGWEILYKPSNEPSILAAKHPKMKPFDFVGEEIAVWIDGSVKLKNEGKKWKDFCLDVSANDVNIMAWTHPENRKCIYEEGAHCTTIMWWKYKDYPIEKQVEYYQSQGMPKDFGLWACGSLLWRNTIEAKEFGDAWLREQYKWSIQDQISFPYLLWKLKPKFKAFPVHEYINQYLEFLSHKND